MDNSLATIVENRLADVNTTYISDSAGLGKTMFGTLALALEENQDNIDVLAQNVGGWLAESRARKITRDFEKNSTWWEKYIWNDPAKVAKMERKRDRESEIFNFLGQIGVQLFSQGTKAILARADQNAIRKYIWKICASFACDVCDCELDKYPNIPLFLRVLGRQLNVPAENEDILNAQYTLPGEFELDEAQNMQLADVLFEIFLGRFNRDIALMKESTDEVATEIDRLLRWCNMLGLDVDEAADHFAECLQKQADGNDPYLAINCLMDCLVSNLTFRLPNIDRSVAWRVNEEFGRYVPNSITQQQARVVGRGIKKIAVAGGYLAGGIYLGDPSLIVTAASEALSLFKIDTPEMAEVAARCLLESGVGQDQMVTALEDNLTGEARRKPKIILPS